MRTKTTPIPVSILRVAEMISDAKELLRIMNDNHGGMPVSFRIRLDAQWSDGATLRHDEAEGERMRKTARA